jgi:hypothetical protein
MGIDLESQKRREEEHLHLSNLALTDRRRLMKREPPEAPCKDLRSSTICLAVREHEQGAGGCTGHS